MQKVSGHGGVRIIRRALTPVRKVQGQFGQGTVESWSRAGQGPFRGCSGASLGTNFKQKNPPKNMLLGIGLRAQIEKIIQINSHFVEML